MLEKIRTQTYVSIIKFVNGYITSTSQMLIVDCTLKPQPLSSYRNLSSDKIFEREHNHLQSYLERKLVTRELFKFLSFTSVFELTDCSRSFVVM